MEQQVGVSEARKDFSSMVEQVQHQGDTYVISRHGKPAAVVVPLHVYEAWKQQRREFFETMRNAARRSRLSETEALSLALGAQKRRRDGRD